MRTHVILAVLKRNLMSYFSGVLGYLFIGVFVVAAAWSAFNAQFFTNNLANLDQLTASFPFLLLFIIPAITMTAWADEKRQGTDELLFTLPASDLDILLGKYLALVVVYTIALLFSTVQIGVLLIYAKPDLSLLFATYFGYWLAGAALIAAGMFASVLSSSVTVAFVLGSVICAVPVFVGTIGQNMPHSRDLQELSFSFGDTVARFCQDLSLAERLREFAIGVVPFSGMVYFGSLIAFFLYLNLVFIGRRHWIKQTQGMPMEGHCTTRVVCLGIALIASNMVVSRASEWMGMRFDLTSEKLYTLSRTTTDLMSKIDKNQPVTIQAFISPQVPREFVGHQTRLKGLLQQYDRMGGSAVEVRIVDVLPLSEAADEARHFGIEPNRSQTDRDGRIQIEDVFLGAVVSSPLDQVIIPFFEQGSSIEYELTRSIRTVTQKERLTVGILQSDAKVNGGFDMQSFRSNPEWRIKQELKKQYNVKEVAADAKIEEKLDVLVAVLPSSLSEPQLANLVDYMKAGKPVLVMDDPLPLIDPRNSPSQPKQSQGGGMGGMFGGGRQEPRAHKGMATPLVDALEIEWLNDTVVWDQTNPHPQFADVLQPEYVFITPQSGNPEAISTKSDVTSGLQEILALFAGRIRPRSGSKLKFEPLLVTGARSGLSKWDDLVSPGFMGMMQFKQNNARRLGKEAHCIAARISGEGEGPKINAIYVADIDIISDALFNVVQNQMHELRLDNVKFILNCVDTLAGDTSYVDLRKRRPQHRALTGLQMAADVFRAESQKEKEKAETDAKEAVEKLKGDLEKEAESISNDKNLSMFEKQQKLEMAQQRKQRELEVKEVDIQRKKEAQIDRLKAREQRQIRQMEGNIRLWAVLLPPIPAIALAIIVLSMRLAAERRDIEEIRRLSRSN